MEELEGIHQEAFEALPKMDPVLGAVVEEIGVLEPVLQEDYFRALVQKIIYQQLSGKAAASILKRVEDMADGRYDPEVLASFSQAEYRAAGVSRQKYSYISDLCRNFIEDAAFFEHLEDHSDEEVTEKLTRVRGIGVWTAQMFLMFTLGRTDVFAPDDLGLANAIVKLYDFAEKPKRKELAAFAERWRPYRSMASRYLWRSLDGPAEV